MKKPKAIRTLSQFFEADPKCYSPEPDVMPGPEQGGVEYLQRILRMTNLRRGPDEKMSVLENFLAVTHYVEILASAKIIEPALAHTIIDTAIGMRGRDQENRHGR